MFALIHYVYTFHSISYYRIETFPTEYAFNPLETGDCCDHLNAIGYFYIFQYFYKPLCSGIFWEIVKKRLLDTNYMYNKICSGIEEALKMLSYLEVNTL